MPKRKSDNLDFVPSLSPSKDEVVTRQQVRGKPAVQDVVREHDVSAEVSESAGGSAFLVAASVLGFVLVCLGGGYLYWQVQELQQELRSARQVAAEQVELLSGRLSQTGEAISKEGGNVDGKLKFHDSEIRKLWDVANKRNKKAIDSNKRRFEASQKRVAASAKQLEASVKQVSGEAAKNNVALSSVLGALEQVRASQADVEERVGSMQARAAQIELLQSSLGDRLASELNSLNAIKSQVAKLGVSASAGASVSSAEVTSLRASLVLSAQKLEQRIVVNEQAIKAIDSHRAQLNRNLERIQRESERVYRLVDSTLKDPQP